MKGKYGVSMNSIEYYKKPKAIPSDCECCYHSKKSYWGSLYCTFYGKHDPNKTKCKRYWCTKPVPKNRKKSNKNH